MASSKRTPEKSRQALEFWKLLHVNEWVISPTVEEGKHKPIRVRFKSDLFLNERRFDKVEYDRLFPDVGALYGAPRDGRYATVQKLSGCSLHVSAPLDIDRKLDPKLLIVGADIGEGAHGKVYHARYGNQIIAVKILKCGSNLEEEASLKDWFIREVTMMSKVKHENLIKQTRPSLTEEIPTDLAFIMKSCWVEEANVRPSFSQIIGMLNAFLLTIMPPSSPTPEPADEITGEVPCNGITTISSALARGKSLSCASFSRQRGQGTYNKLHVGKSLCCASFSRQRGQGTYNKLSG